MTLAILSAPLSRGTNVYPPPDYHTFRPPAAAATYVDPVFGTTIKRLSDARRTRDAVTGQYLEFIANPSSTVSPFNSDGSLLLLQHQNYLGLYDGEGNFLIHLPAEIGVSARPRWSGRDPRVLYYATGNELKRFDVATGVSLLLSAFDEYASVQMSDSGDDCADGDHLALAGDGQYIFVYEVSTGRKGRDLFTAGNTFESFAVTPRHNVVVSWRAPGRGPFRGIELFDGNMSFLRQLAPAGGSAVVTRDADGQEVLIWSNAADPLPICTNGVVKVRLADTEQSCLVSLDPHLAIRVSAPDGTGWSFVATYANGPLNPYDGGWPPYANELLQVKLDGSEIRRLAHHRSRPSDSHGQASRLAASRAGTALIYSSNYGLPSLLKYPESYTDTYLIALPASHAPHDHSAGDVRSGSPTGAPTGPAVADQVASTCGSSDDAVHTLPRLSPPARGQSYVDPTYGCTIKRLSNAAVEGTAYVTHLYSSVNPFNADSTRVLLEKGGGVMHVRDLNGHIVADNLGAAGIDPASSAFWSRTDPNVIYFHPARGNQLRSYNVSTGVATTLHTFSSYSAVSFGMGEGDISWDGDHLPVVGDGRWGFIFTISTKTSTKTVDLSVYGSPNHADVTPGNQFYAGFGSGTHVWDQAMNYKRQIIGNAPHADRGADVDGTDVAVVTNSGDSSVQPACTNGQVKINLDTGASQCLKAFTWTFSTHTSCNNVGQGWCLVSTYSTSGWSAYENELLMIKLDGSETLRLAHTRSTNSSYGHISRAAVSHDGRYVLFDSDMQGLVVDVYLLSVPDTAPADARPSASSTPRPRRSLPPERRSRGTPLKPATPGSNTVPGPVTAARHP